MSAIQTSNVSTAFKVNAAIPVALRAAFYSHPITIGLRNDGTSKIKLVSFMMTTNYTNDSKVVNFSLSFQEFTGKEKGNFIEVARLTPCHKKGLTLSFFQGARVSRQDVQEVIETFVGVYTAKHNVERGNLPQHFYVLATVFQACKVQHSEGIDNVPTIADLKDDQIWKDTIASLPSIFPQFYCQLPGKVEEKTIEGSEQTTDSTSDQLLELKKLSKPELQQLCKDATIEFTDKDSKNVLADKLNAVM